jgi:hypothetical protein
LKCTFWIFVWNFLRNQAVQGTGGNTVWGLMGTFSGVLATIAACFFMGFEVDCMGKHPEK